MMSRRQAVLPAPAPLEAYAQAFDPLFARSNQRQGFRHYLEGLLLPSERNKTLTALANTEPVVGAQQPRAQALQWFLSESTWDPAEINRCRLDLLRSGPRTAPDEQGVLVIDEHGDRKWGHQTAHIGKQYLANLGKVDTGVVSVTSLWADEAVYYPLDVEPYTPAHHFPGGKGDPQFRTKLRIAQQLVERAVAAGIPFRAVVADAFYGDDGGFQQGLWQLRIGFVLAVPPSHGWWHAPDRIGSLYEAAVAAGWQDEQQPGRWQKIERRFRDGHTDAWWALEVAAGPYGPERLLRAAVVTTDPASLPERSTWYLVTNLPAPGSNRARAEGALPAADLVEIVRLYGLRIWVEQSYKQVKYALGWREYQVRSDLAIRRHWALVCCAFSFCWLYGDATPGEEAPLAAVAAESQDAVSPPPTTTSGGKKWSGTPTAAPLLAHGAAGHPRLAGTLVHAHALLAGLVQSAPAGSPGYAA